MLRITVPAGEFFDERTGLFHVTKETVLQLEHSLVSVSKWESRWKKPFLGKDQKTEEECRHYVQCMTITQNVDPYVYYALTPENFEEVNNYIEDTMTATWFSDRDTRPYGRRNAVTAEVIYYWMISLGIPFECQKWHLNRLLTLVRVCNIKNTPSKKSSRRELMDHNRALNNARRSRTGSRG